MKTRKITPAIALLAAALLTAAVADSETIRARIAPASERKAAPAIKLLDGSDKIVRLSDFRGKPLLLNLWATECGGCILEIPTFVQLNHDYQAKGLTVIGVSMDIMYENLKNSSEAWGRVKPFVATHKVDYQNLMGNDEITRSYDVQALPITHLIDRSGRIAATYIGVVNKEDLETNIRKLLSEP